MRLIDADELYERTAEWEAQAEAYIENLNRTPLDEMTEDEKSEWRRWTAIMGERTAFKHDVADAPTIEAEPRWIPVTERLPEMPFGCLVTVWDTNPVTMDEFENILPYFVGWDGKQWNDADGEQCPFEVVAWMPLPEPARLENS